MSSLAYGNGVPSADDISIPPIIPSSGAIIQHPYLASNSYAAAAAAAASSASSSSLGQYPHYYNHQLPQQQLLHVQPTSSFYPPTALGHLQHQTDFSNSSSSAASSSSSMESSRKAVNRKRTTDKTNVAGKSNNKRKAPNHDEDELDDDEDDDDEENKCYLRGNSLSNIIMPTNNTNNANNNSTGGTPGDEDKEKQARENHCEIERRRRVKMATYFAELCEMVPSCANLARKPDKLTILRMAAQYMKNLRSSNSSLSLNSTQISQQDIHKPSFLNDNELKYLMVESCDAFLFALNCDNLRVIYISDAIHHILSYTCHDWYSRFFYDFVHPDDVEKVREQLNLQPQDGSPNTNGNSRVLDLKTGTVKKDGHSSSARLISSKRSFICRLRVGSANPLDPTHQSPFINPSALRRRHRVSLGPSIDGQIYEVVHISGYIRNLNTQHHSSSHHDNTNHHPSSSNSNGQMAFIGIARIQNSCLPNVNDLTNGSTSSINSITTEFTCRCHWDTGDILFVDQRCTPIVGYKTHELLHKLIYEYVHPDDHMKLQDLFKRTVTQKNSLTNSSPHLANIIIRFRTHIDNEYMSLKTSTYAFCNPCTDEIEFIIVTFLSTNKASVITNSNDYNRPTYDTYSRTTATANVPNQNQSVHYAPQSPSTYNNSEGQDYSTGNNDGRTYASNNGGSTWASANDSWTAAAAAAAAAANNSHVSSTSNPDYVDTQANLALYHQYH